MKPEFREAIADLYADADDLRTAFSYHRRTAAATYTTATGAVGGAVTVLALRGLFYDWEDRKIDGDVVRPGDRIVEVEAAVAEAAAVAAGTTWAPKLDDWITVGGAKYEIIRHLPDASQAMTRLHVRIGV
jgi:hypothetical protein